MLQGGNFPRLGPPAVVPGKLAASEFECWPKKSFGAPRKGEKSSKPPHRVLPVVWEASDPLGKAISMLLLRSMNQNCLDSVSPGLGWAGAKGASGRADKRGGKAGRGFGGWICSSSTFCKPNRTQRTFSDPEL